MHQAEDAIVIEWCIQDLRRICRLRLSFLSYPLHCPDAGPQGISFDTKAKILPYKIMYLLTGGLAIVVGIAVILFMPDSPLHATFLTRKERIIAVERVRDDQGGTENKTIKRRQVIEAFSDVRSWLTVLLTCMSKSLLGGMVMYYDT